MVLLCKLLWYLARYCGTTLQVIVVLHTLEVIMKWYRIRWYNVD
jgi:hypothetical protein